MAAPGSSMAFVRYGLSIAFPSLRAPKSQGSGEAGKGGGGGQARAVCQLSACQVVPACLPAPACLPRLFKRSSPPFQKLFPATDSSWAGGASWLQAPGTGSAAAAGRRPAVPAGLDSAGPGRPAKGRHGIGLGGGDSGAGAPLRPITTPEKGGGRKAGRSETATWFDGGSGTRCSRIH
jgi:hypothetical protein